MNPYRRLFDSALVRVDAERAHRSALALLRVAGAPGIAGVVRRTLAEPVGAPVEAMGLRFTGPLGLAAGFDKDARVLGGLAGLGFGFVEVGTVTGQPQPGNPRPRLFRLPADRAVVNRMGFNNDGAVAVAARLAAWRRRHPRSPLVVGVNIGRSKAVGDAGAVADYQASARLLSPYADYLVVNVSSPNTPGLRDLQAVERLRPLLLAVRDEADASSGRRVPLLAKIAPDLTDDEVLAIADLAGDIGLDGIVACNTTVRRDGLRSDPRVVAAAGEGGLSGPPLAARSSEILGLLRDRVGAELVLVSVGGIGDAADVRARLAAGATLVQAYTAFVYGGPRWPAQVQRDLVALTAAPAAAR